MSDYTTVTLDRETSNKIEEIAAHTALKKITIVRKAVNLFYEQLTGSNSSTPTSTPETDQQNQ